VTAAAAAAAAAIVVGLFVVAYAFHFLPSRFKSFN